MKKKAFKKYLTALYKAKLCEVMIVLALCSGAVVLAYTLIYGIGLPTILFRHYHTPASFLLGLLPIWVITNMIAAAFLYDKPEAHIEITATSIMITLGVTFINLIASFAAP